MQHVDVVVIGLGPGGEHVAGSLAEAGLSVVGVDRLLVGGECPYWGCVPSKMMIRAADLLAEARRVPGMAGATEVTPDWAPVARRIREEATDSWDDRVAVERFEGKGGRFIRGTGRLAGPNRVVIEGADGNDIEELEVSRAVVLATGSQASTPPIPGLDEVDHWTNREAIETETVPRSLVVLGGGAIGVELGQVFSRFGSLVHVVEGLDRLVPPEEPEVAALLREVFEREGIDVSTGASATKVAREGDDIVVSLEDGTMARGERLLVATGRRVDVAGLAVETIGVDPSQRAVPVDDHLRVADGVWAVGDVTGKGAFTHVAMYQADIVIADVLGREVVPADYHALPRVTFTDPEIGSVGLTAQAARDEGIDVRTGLAKVPETAHGWIHKAGNDGLIKVVEDRDRGVLVGATAMGPTGGEVLGFLALAVHAAVPVHELRHMIYAYPTIHRGIEDAVRDLG